MRKQTNISHGLQWGLILGLVYCVLLFLRYNQGSSTPVMLGIWSFIGFAVIMVLLLICGFQRRKQLGGYIELKDAFQTMFIAVLIFELFYLIFNFIYLKYIDPNFYSNMKDSMEAFMEKSNVSQEKIDEALEQMEKQSTEGFKISNILLSYLMSVAISGVFALIFALIIRRKNPFGTTNDQFLQNQQTN